MQSNIGVDYFKAREGRRVVVALNSAELINPHALILGMSGTGKSVSLRTMISSAVASSLKLRFHVMDVHGDLELPGASVVAFGEQAKFGLNPFRVNPSLEFGGVRKAIQAFIRTIDQASRTPLGLKQEAVLRELAEEVYMDFGFDKSNPATWALNDLGGGLVSAGADNRLYLDVPYADKDKARASGGRWCGDKKLWYVQTQLYTGAITAFPPAYRERVYPSLDDILKHADRVYMEKKLGSDQRAFKALEHVNTAAKARQRKILDKVRLNRRDENLYDEETELALAEARVKAIQAYTDFVNTIQTGLELEQHTKYKNPQVLESISDRLRNLNATGIFKAAAPPFDPSNQIWRYKLNALALEEKKMLVLFLLQDLFYKAVERGEQREVLDIIVLDEMGTYTSSADEKGDGIIGTIAREARKFGLGLWAANQSLDGVPASLIASVGTKIVLGLDEGQWPEAIKKLRLDQKLMSWIQPHKTLAAQLKMKGAQAASWKWVNIEKPDFI